MVKDASSWLCNQIDERGVQLSVEDEEILRRSVDTGWLNLTWMDPLSAVHVVEWIAGYSSSPTRAELAHLELSRAAKVAKMEYYLLLEKRRIAFTMQKGETDLINRSETNVIDFVSDLAAEFIEGRRMEER